MNSLKYKSGDLLQPICGDVYLRYINVFNVAIITNQLVTNRVMFIKNCENFYFSEKFMTILYNHKLCLAVKDEIGLVK